MDKQQAADEKSRLSVNKESDFLAMIKLWNYPKEQQKTLSAAQFGKLCSSDFLKYLRVREWHDLYTQLRQVVKEVGLPNNNIQLKK